MALEDFRIFDLPRDYKTKSFSIDTIVDNHLKPRLIEDDADIEAGLTYIGQLIAHDIVPSSRSSLGRQKVSPALLLDSIYGDLNHSALFYRFGFFVLKKNENGVLDVLRNFDKSILIPEERNGENLIILQLHILFQKLHNKILKQLYDTSHFFSNDIVSFARLIVVRTFHTIVEKHFFNQILNKSVHLHYFNEKPGVSYLFSANINAIPLEFSTAAFRFGHSMVRNRYNINKQTSLSLIELFEASKTPITGVNEIHWGRLFQLDEWDKNKGLNDNLDSLKFNDFMPPAPAFDRAKSINTVFAEGITSIPHHFQINDKLSENGIDVRKANISTSQNHQTLSYTDILEKMKKLIPDELIQEIMQTLDQMESKEKNQLPVLPLWVSMLMESEVTGKLGPLSSIIVIEVLNQSILLAKSFFKKSDIEDADRFISDHILIEEYKRFGHVINYINGSTHK